MNQPFITEERVEAALDFLRENADAVGDAKAEAVRADKMLKHIRAIEMKKNTLLPLGGQEREADSSPAYREAIERDAVAAGEYEKLKAKREYASMIIEVWRSLGANYRSMRIGD